MKKIDPPNYIGKYREVLVVRQPASQFTGIRCKKNAINLDPPGKGASDASIQSRERPVVTARKISAAHRADTASHLDSTVHTLARPR